MNGPIEVYADRSEDEPAKRLGTLRVRFRRTSEPFDFTFDESAIRDTAILKQSLDPDLGLFAGRNFPETGARSSASSKIPARIAGEKLSSTPLRSGQTRRRRSAKRAAWRIRIFTRRPRYLSIRGATLQTHGRRATPRQSRRKRCATTVRKPTRARGSKPRNRRRYPQ